MKACVLYVNLKWLADEKSEDIRAVGGFLDSPNSMGSGFPVTLSQGEAGQKEPEREIPDDDISVYSGPEGKRRAAEMFLKEVIEQETQGRFFFTAMKSPTG